MLSPKRNSIIELCLDVRAWRLTTPQVSILNEIDVDKNVLMLDEAFAEAKEAAIQACDEDTLEELINLQHHFDQQSQE